MNKKFTYKVYDNETGSYITTWQKDVINTPNFTTVINGSPGELIISLARNFDDFDEGVSVKLDNKVDVYVFDNEAPEGTVLYRGYISSYEVVVGQRGNQTVRVTLLPLFSEASRYILEVNGATTVSYNSTDPSTIFSSVLSNFLSQSVRYPVIPGAQWDISYWDSDYWDRGPVGEISTTGSTVSYTFKTNTIQECLEKCVELSPDGWFFRIDPDSTIVFSSKSLESNHNIYLGKNVGGFSFQKRVENITNEIYFLGGGDPELYKKYTRPASIASYGKYALRLSDGRVTTESTADLLADRELDQNESFETRMSLNLVDNNGYDSNKGYDIESIKVGQTINLKNISASAKTSTLWDFASWDSSYWDFSVTDSLSQSLIIVRTRYSEGGIEIETSSKFPEVTKRVEDIYRNQTQSEFNNAGVTPDS